MLTLITLQVSYNLANNVMIESYIKFFLKKKFHVEFNLPILTNFCGFLRYYMKSDKNSFLQIVSFKNIACDLES